MGNNIRQDLNNSYQKHSNTCNTTEVKISITLSKTHNLYIFIFTFSNDKISQHTL